MIRILITHNDLDGAACAVVWRHFYDGLVYHCNYDTIDAVVAQVCAEKPDADVVLADISPKNIPDDLWARIAIYDHHANNDFPKRLEAGMARGIFDGAKCGARILAEALYGHAPIPGEYLRQVEAWDLWKLDSPDRPAGAAHHAALQFYGMGAYIDARTRSLRLFVHEQDVVRIVEARNASYIAGRVKAAQLAEDPDGRTFRWVYASQCTSEVGSAIAAGVDYGAVLVPEYNKVELRSAAGGSNVGQIAKSRGGGGHDRAAGYPMRFGGL